MTNLTTIEIEDSEKITKTKKVKTTEIKIPSIPVIFLTYNRLKYTEQALSALSKTVYPIEIYIHDNGSTDGTAEWLDTIGRHYPQVKKVVLNKENIGLNKPINNFLRENKNAEFIAKVDNDTIVEPYWICHLMTVMMEKPEMDAVGAYMQRPPGSAGSFQQWVDSDFMRKVDFYPKMHPIGSYHTTLAYCAYCGGTGVLIRMRMFKEMGLLWEGYKSMQGDLTCMFRLRSKNGTLDNVAWYSDTTVKLLNIKIDGVELSDDYPEYDKELNAYRDAGNKWYVENGGPAGIQKLIDSQGGRERI